MITIVVLAGGANRSLINFALYCVLFSESILYKLNVSGIFLSNAKQKKPFVLRDNEINDASHQPPFVKTIQVLYS